MTDIFKAITSVLFLSGMSVGAIIIILIAIVVLLCPNKVKQWASMIAWTLSSVGIKLEYFAIKNQVEGEINDYVSWLESKTTAIFPQISIKFIAKGMEEIIWEDGEAIVVMRDRKYKKKNVVHAVYFFTSETLLSKSKKHLSKHQKDSLNLFATFKILERQNAASAEQFMSDYFTPSVEKSDQIRGYIKQYTNIERIGVFFPVLIQELTYLGNKIFLENPTEEVIDEVKSLINFLEVFSQRQVGDTETQEEFIGTYMRCAIKIVASRSSREAGNVEMHKSRISTAINQNLENIYIIGRSDQSNDKFIDEVIDAVIKQYAHIEKVKKYYFSGTIKRQGCDQKVQSYLVHIRNPEAVMHLYGADDTKKWR